MTDAWAAAGRGDDLSGVEVIFLAFAQEEERAWCAIFFAIDDRVIVVDGYVGLADDLEGIFLYQDGCSLVEAYADELGCFFDNIDEIELAVTAEDMLVDD